MATKNITAAEKWADALRDVEEDGSEWDELMEAMAKEQQNHYSDCDDWDYFLFADASVFGYALDQRFTKASLREPSNAELYDGLIRIFWPGTLPERGDMSMLLDTEAFAESAGNRTYHFTFGTWERMDGWGHFEYTVDVLALFYSAKANAQPKACEFTLCIRDSCCGDKTEIDCCDVDYAEMPLPDVGASWNNPLRWQEVVDDMESFCASIA